MWAKWFPTALYVLAVMAIASVVFSLAGPLFGFTILAKPAFLYGAAVASGCFGLAGSFVKRMTAKGNAYSHPFNGNVAMAVTLGVIVLAGMIVGLPLESFTDMVFEGLAVSIAGLGIGVSGALVDKDEEEEEK